MPAFAVLPGLAAAVCYYLAAPNQVLTFAPCPPRWRRPLCWLALALTVACAWMGSLAHGGPAAVAAALVTVTSGLSLWPLAGAWIHARRLRARSHAA